MFSHQCCGWNVQSNSWVRLHNFSLQHSGWYYRPRIMSMLCLHLLPLRSHSLCLADGVTPSLWLSGMCPSRLAVDWQSVDLSVSGTGGLRSQPSSPPSADRQGQGLIPPISLSSWQPLRGETNPKQPCPAWHAPSPINIVSLFSNLLQGLFDQATSLPCTSSSPQPPSIPGRGPPRRKIKK